MITLQEAMYLALTIALIIALVFDSIDTKPPRH